MKDNLDIVILTPWFPNQPNGWPARFIADSALALSRMGHRIRIGVTRGYVPPAMASWVPVEHRGRIDVKAFHGIDVIREERHLALPRGIFRRLTNRSLDASVGRLLSEFVSERKPDIVLVHTETLAPGAVARAHILGIPIAVILHGENTNAAYLTASGQRERFRNALTEADRLILVGAPLIPYAEKLAGRNDHIEVIWNGVTPPNATRGAPNPDNAPIELIAVANLQKGKGIDLLLKALEQINSEGVRNWRLRIIGDGPMMDELVIFAKNSGLDSRVRFLGVLANNQVFDELIQADVFVLPSYREAFGVAYLEAMASGLLTIGVVGQGPGQFIRDKETGLLIEPRSVEAIAVILRAVLTDDRNWWRRISKLGEKFVRTQMTWDVHGTQLTKALASICK